MESAYTGRVFAILEIITYILYQPFYDICMKFTRRVDTIGKYVKTTNSCNHYMRCSICESRQDFDNMSRIEAKKAVADAGWREGIDDDKEEHCLCPECVEEHEVVIKTSHDLEFNSYD
jgi:hypothetical protein